MPTPTFQTVALKSGRHASPEKGVCVMELASMIAGEPFTDRPACASPVIGAFLRAYNDRVSDRRRQDLYRCAAAVVGTRASAGVERERRRRCRLALAEVAWLRSRSLLWRLRSPDPRHLIDAMVELPIDESMWLLAHVVALGGDTGHAYALHLVDHLVALGSSPVAAGGVPEPAGAAVG